MESIISTFHIDWKIILAQAFNFGVVFVVLYIFALKPLNKLMAERADKIAKGVADAESNEKILQDTSLKYEEALTKARVEADKIFQQGKKEAENKRVLMLDKAKAEVDGIVLSGKKELKAEKLKIVADAKKEIINLTMLATKKVVGQENVNIDESIIKELQNL